MSAHGNSTEEEFQVVKLIENNAPFSMLLGKPWIEKDQARRKEEESLEQNKQELKDFMTRRNAHFIEEQENQVKLFQTRDLDVEFARKLEDPQKTKVPIPSTDEVLPFISTKEPQQRKFTLPKEDKNQNGKRNFETKLIGDKAEN
jgi:hypothetical protein